MTAHTTLNSPYSPISLDHVLRAFPSIGQTQAHFKTSEKYANVVTGNVLQTMAANGFEIYAASEARVRLDHKRGFQKHMLRLRHVSTRVDSMRAPEIIMLNSHDGANGYRLISGLLEFACLNGIITGTRFESFSIRHSGNAADKVTDAALRLMTELPRLADSVRQMQARTLTLGGQRELAERALIARYGDEPVPFGVDQMLFARRDADDNASLWSTFQRVQENITQGGAQAIVRGTNGRLRRTSMRRVKAIDANVNLNRALWDIADSYIDRTPRPLIGADYTVIA